ncbi:MAG: hypothetical protein KDK29_02130 [Sedimentitalea sp.]|nr:hypothetical protein [Sedimentitalea sp.]
MTIETFIVLMVTLLLIVGAMIALTSDGPPPHDAKSDPKGDRASPRSGRQTR